MDIKSVIDKFEIEEKVLKSFSEPEYREECLTQWNYAEGLLHEIESILYVDYDSIDEEDVVKMINIQDKVSRQSQYLEEIFDDLT